MTQLQTGFLPGPNGSLHLSVFRPSERYIASHWVVHIPAFAEEMNKSRAMVARQARALAEEGIVVVVPDLTGTGDSSGLLEEVSWLGWLEDIKCIAEWVRAQGAIQLSLWGNRFGCLLAVDAAGVLPTPPDQLVFWQPVHSGRQYMTQFLRLRMAAGLAAGGSETAATLRERLAVEGSLEVAGYRLSANLFLDIESKVLAALSVPAGTVVRILEVTGEVSKSLPVTEKLVEQWMQAGLDCTAHSVPGAPFWMTQELSFVPDLVEKTVAELKLGPETDGQASDLHSADSGQVNVPPAGLISESTEDGTRALVFSCGESQLAGILHRASNPSELGVLIVVGGPQYRVGSHRQFVHLARHMASSGVPTLRFDYRGMGDSDGQLLGFETIGQDIRSAIEALQREDTAISKIVLWGLCDAATAAVFYAPDDARVSGLILANPWVYSPQGVAKAYLKHYYVQRLFQREFWGKVLSGQYSLFASLVSAWGLVKKAVTGGPADAVTTDSAAPLGAADVSTNSPEERSLVSSVDLVTRFTDSFARFTGRTSFILSGNDITAAEFVDATRSNRNLLKLMQRSNVVQVKLPAVDHTFSKGKWRGEVEALSLEAIKRRGAR